MQMISALRVRRVRREPGAPQRFRRRGEKGDAAAHFVKLTIEIEKKRDYNGHIFLEEGFRDNDID